jgi:type IV secretory pathway VirB6-like protein
MMGEVGMNDEGEEEKWMHQALRYPALVHFVFFLLIFVFTYYVYSVIGAQWCQKVGTACMRLGGLIVCSVASAGRTASGMGRSKG